MPHDEVAHVDVPLRKDISTSAHIGRTLFVGCDETASVECLTWRAGRFGDHRSVSLGRFFDLPDEPDGEMDIEGPAVDGGYLWVTGSHSLKRGKPDPAEGNRQAVLDTLRRIKSDPNRYFLGRIPRARGALVHVSNPSRWRSSAAINPA